MKNYRLYNANPPNAPAGGSPSAGGSSPSASPPAVTPPVTPPAETEEQRRIKALEAQNREIMATNSALLNKVAQLTPAKPVAPPPQPQDNRTKWWTDPEAAFNEKTAPLVQGVTQTQAYLIKEQMKTKYAKEFKLWGPEIDELTSPLNPMFLMDPATWEIIIERVRGRHVQDYAKDPSMVPGYSESSSPSDPPAQKTAQQQLSERELKIAKQLGVTPEKYLAQKQKMVVGV